MAVEAALEGKWALILGASSGFGGAAARGFANAGMNVFGVHLDRRATQGNVDAIVADIEAAGREALFINMNAADAEKRTDALDQMRAKLDDGSPIRILMHSLAFGTLGAYVNTEEPGGRQISQRQLEMTLDVMANSLVYWVQGMMARTLLGEGSKIYGMTSAGDARVIPQYAAVSAAKAALGRLKNSGSANISVMRTRTPLIRAATWVLPPARPMTTPRERLAHTTKLELSAAPRFAPPSATSS